MDVKDVASTHMAVRRESRGP